MSSSGNPPYSENVVKILDAAVNAAKSRRHAVVGTEHVIFAICSQSNRALHWIAKTAFPEKTYDEVQYSIIEWLESRDGFQPIGPPGDAITEPSFSVPLEAALNIAKRIGDGPVQDGDNLITGGLVASEFLLAGIIVEGTGIGASALTRCSSGKVNSNSVLTAVGASDKVLLPKITDSSQYWQHYCTPTASSCPSLESWYPSGSVGDIKGRFDGIAKSHTAMVTKDSNWIIPGKLIIGEHPSADNAMCLVKAGVNVFVSLIGEYSFDTYMSVRYPAALVAASDVSSVPLQFIHFPIRDFEVAEPVGLATLVDQLKKLLFAGHTVFLHCRGGHGRTGMVVIALLSAVYDCSTTDAQAWVEYSTKHYRESDIRWKDYVHMPETDEQADVIHNVESKVRKHTR